MSNLHESSAYAEGRDLALTGLGLEKVAFFTAARNAWNAVRPWASNAINTGKATYAAGGGLRSAVSTGLGHAGSTASTAADAAVQSGFGKVLGDRGAQFAGTYLKGMPGEIAKQTALGAGIQGGLEAGIGAYTADPGERWEGAARGAAHGALSGGAFGAASGVLMNPVMNARRAHLEHIGTSRGLSGDALHKAVESTQNRGFFGSVNDVARAGTDKLRGIHPDGRRALGWQGSLSNAIGGPAEQAAMFAPMFLLPQAIQDPDVFRPKGHGAQAQTQQQQQQQQQQQPQPQGYPQEPKYAAADDATIVRPGAPVLAYDPVDVDKDPLIDPMSLSTMLGASTGAATASLGAKALANHLGLPADSLRAAALNAYAPITGALVGTLGGRAIGREFKYDADKAKSKNKPKNLKEHLQKRANLFRLGPGGVQNLVPKATAAAEHALPALAGQTAERGGLGAAHAGLFSTAPSTAKGVPAVQELGYKPWGLPTKDAVPATSPVVHKVVEAPTATLTTYRPPAPAAAAPVPAAAAPTAPLPGFTPRVGGPRRQLLGSG